MKEQLLSKRPIDLLFQLSIPAVIGMIVIGLYPLMDGIFIRFKELDISSFLIKKIDRKSNY